MKIKLLSSFPQGLESLTRLIRNLQRGRCDVKGGGDVRNDDVLWNLSHVNGTLTHLVS